MLELSRRAFLGEAGALSSLLIFGACSETTPDGASPQVALTGTPATVPPGLDPKYETAPKSASVSISASATPVAIAGRASGNPTRQNPRHGPAPKARATS